MGENKQSTYEKGKKFEQLAGAYLVKNGCSVIEYNYRYKGGEIDIIARDDETLVFVEVKYRKLTRSEDFGGVHLAKQRRISKGALLYMTRQQLIDKPCRFDVILIVGEEIHWIQNAFDYCN